jgi:hypothetical protein
MRNQSERCKYVMG